MDIFKNNRVQLGVALVLFIVIIYFLINYQVKSTLRNEFQKMHMKKQKRLKQEKVRQQRRAQEMETKQTFGDIDSYIDPLVAENEGHHNNEHFDQRLSQDDMLMRDITDGSR